MIDLNKLQTYLDGENNEHGLDFNATHGFLCATVVGPSLADWLNELFDKKKYDVPSEVLDSITQWRLDIINTLKDESPIELPFDDSALEVESELGDWSVGFVDAIYANEDTDWFDTASIDDIDADDDEVATLTLPMVVFSGIEEDDAELNSIRKNPELMEEMANSLTTNLTELYLLFHTPS